MRTIKQRVAVIAKLELKGALLARGGVVLIGNKGRRSGSGHARNGHITIFRLAQLEFRNVHVHDVGCLVGSGRSNDTVDRRVTLRKHERLGEERFALGLDGTKSLDAVSRLEIALRKTAATVHDRNRFALVRLRVLVIQQHAAVVGDKELNRGALLGANQSGVGNGLIDKPFGVALVFVWSRELKDIQLLMLIIARTNALERKESIVTVPQTQPLDLGVERIADLGCVLVSGPVHIARAVVGKPVLVLALVVHAENTRRFVGRIAKERIGIPRPFVFAHAHIGHAAAEGLHALGGTIGKVETGIQQALGVKELRDRVIPRVRRHARRGGEDADLRLRIITEDLILSCVLGHLPIQIRTADNDRRDVPAVGSRGLSRNDRGIGQVLMAAIRLHAVLVGERHPRDGLTDNGSVFPRVGNGSGVIRVVSHLRAENEHRGDGLCRNFFEADVLIALEHTRKQRDGHVVTLRAILALDRELVHVKIIVAQGGAGYPFAFQTGRKFEIDRTDFAPCAIVLVLHRETREIRFAILNGRDAEHRRLGSALARRIDTAHAHELRTTVAINFLEDLSRGAFDTLVADTGKARSAGTATDKLIARGFIGITGVCAHRHLLPTCGQVAQLIVSGTGIGKSARIRIVIAERGDRDAALRIIRDKIGIGAHERKGAIAVVDRLELRLQLVSIVIQRGKARARFGGHLVLANRLELLSRYGGETEILVLLHGIGALIRNLGEHSQ